MKVLVISKIFPSVFNKALGIFVYRQAEALNKAGCEVKVIGSVPWASFSMKYISKE